MSSVEGGLIEGGLISKKRRSKVQTGILWRIYTRRDHFLRPGASERDQTTHTHINL